MYGGNFGFIVVHLRFYLEENQHINMIRIKCVQ